MIQKQYKSKNPDLLFKEIMNERIPRATEFALYCNDVDIPRRLDRVTILVTHRCNFLCKYCNGPHTNFNRVSKKRKREMLSKDISFKYFKKMIKDWKKHKLKHIHFSGGEPTLNKDLPRMVKLATKSNILASITTNGSADFQVYSKLIENGLTEIRISIEATNSADYDALVGVKGYFNKVIKNISKIVKMRDEEGKNIFLVLNACVGIINLKKIKKILEFLISLSPNDIKFLVIAMERKEVSKQYNQKIIKELNRLLELFSKNRFPLLRDKIGKLFDPGAIGLRDRKTQKVMKHCYIPLTERTINPLYYYPCSIYIRGYGKPIGQLSESFKTQQRKIMQFVKHHDCRKDRICRRICTNCCKIFNVAVNVEISKIKSISLKKKISKKEIKETKEYINSLIHKKEGRLRDKPFIIIKPHGMSIKSKIIRFLKERNIKIEFVKSLNNWHDLSKALYCWPLTRDEIIFTIEMDKAFRKVEREKIEILFLEKISFKELSKIKYELRELFPDKKYLFVVGNKKRIIRSTIVHIPDEKDIKRENIIVNNFISKN